MGHTPFAYKYVGRRDTRLKGIPGDYVPKTPVRQVVRGSIALADPAAYNCINKMNAKFEWFGFSVARRHVYFYLALITTSLGANSMKDSLLGQNVLDFRTTEQLAEMRQQLDSAQDPLAGLP